LHSDPAGELHDAALFQEIRLLGALVLAASRVTRHLTAHEVDAVLQGGDGVLGLPPADSGGRTTDHR
jgi:hypothetical protein